MRELTVSPALTLTLKRRFLQTPCSIAVRRMQALWAFYYFAAELLCVAKPWFVEASGVFSTLLLKEHLFKRVLSIEDGTRTYIAFAVTF